MSAQSPSKILEDASPFGRLDRKPTRQEVMDHLDLIRTYLDTFDEVNEHRRATIAKSYDSDLYTIKDLQDLTGYSRQTIYTILDENGVKRPKIRR